MALAAALFETAVLFGSPFEAYYYLGQIQSAQADTPGMAPGALRDALTTVFLRRGAGYYIYSADRAEAEVEFLGFFSLWEGTP